MAKVLITGSKGKIGSVLTKGLSKNHEITGLDLPEADISDYDFLLEQMAGVDSIVHVAYSKDEQGLGELATGRVDPRNVLLEMNVFQAAIEAKVGRVIMASSVHADDFIDYKSNELLTVPGSYAPTSHYGAHKLILEELGRFYSMRHDLEFVGVRFGGVTADNSVKTDGREPAVWLSHDDLVAAIEACVSAVEVPGKFAVFYAISNNGGRIHSTENPFGWEPKDNSANYITN